MSDFASLGLDVDTAVADLEALGVDLSDYYDSTTGAYSDELASLMLVANLTLQAGVDETADNVEGLIEDYQFQADVLNAMNETFTLARETFGATDGTVSDLITFLEESITYGSVTDLSAWDFEYTFDTSLIPGDSETFESLPDYIDAVENNSDVENDTGSVTAGAIEWAYYQLYSDLQSEGQSVSVVTSTGSSSTIADFASGTADTYIRVVIQPVIDLAVYLDLAQFQQYLVMTALQEAGVIGDELELTIACFADTSFQLTDDYAVSAKYAEWLQLMYGTASYGYDDEGALQITLSASAMCRQMDIDLNDYFSENASVKVDDVSSGDWYESLPSPLDEEDYSSFFEATAGYVFDCTYVPVLIANAKSADTYTTDWDDYVDADLTTDGDWIDAGDLDDIIEGMASEIQSQAAISQLALVETSTAITEWSEFHNGWDTAHKYITDALARCMAFLK